MTTGIATTVGVGVGMGVVTGVGVGLDVRGGCADFREAVGVNAGAEALGFGVGVSSRATVV